MTPEASNKNPGAVLIAGAGIAGMRAALDLAACGIHVYLADRKPSIGGAMTQLDRLFPTDERALDLQTPLLAEIGRHRDIEIIPLSEVESVRGAAGNFQVTLRKQPRYVDTDLCTGCGLCFSGCPVIMKNEFDLGLTERRAIFLPFPQAVPNKPAIDKREERPCDAACMNRCPVHTNVPASARLIAEGRLREAYQMIRNVNPFPSVCGRICRAPCEDACARGLLDGPAAIRGLEMFLADRFNADELPVPRIRKRDGTVAVIGAGPAGLAAANDLALAGYAVTVFEAQPEPGGMLRYAIPEYRLPREALRKEIACIRKLGVDIRTGVEVGNDIPFDAIQRDYDAVFIGTGAPAGMKLDVEGCYLPDVLDGIQFLKSVSIGARVPLGKKIAVVGGGRTAVDCARTARRLGAQQVRIVYRRSRAEMTAPAAEITAAKQEGIRFDFLTLPKGFFPRRGRLAEMRCIGMALGEPDAGGRRWPIPVSGSEFTMSVDTVITAFGQATQLGFLKGSGISLSHNGTVKTAPDTGATPVEGVFAGGDVATADGSVIDAIAAGKRAAQAICRYLEDQPVEAAAEKSLPGSPGEDGIAAPERRVPSPKRVSTGELPVAERIANFHEVALGFDPEEAIREARRCSANRIEGCIECGECARRCSAGAVVHDQREETVELHVGAVILSPGCETVDARVKPEFGYGRFPNVVTGLEFERILSAAGLYSGRVVRPSDRKTLARIAFIQCVGCRDAQRDYCSSVCCMAATKEAIAAKERAQGNLHCDVFFTDLRTFGKGFEEYGEKAKRLGVTYIRCRPAGVEEKAESGNLVIHYLAGKDRKVSGEYDMVVLSTGMRPPSGAQRISHAFGIDLDDHGFCGTSPFRPVESSREGIYVAGPFAEPKDVSETITTASAAVSKVLALLRVRGDNPVSAGNAPATGSALVIGAGISGMTSALGLADQGFDVSLVESGEEIGGNLRDIHYLISGARLHEEFASLIKRVHESGRIRLFTQATIEKIEGGCGSFRTRIAVNGSSEDIEHGAVIVATGAQKYRPREYLYGRDRKVVTQSELEKRLVVVDDFISSPGKGPGTVVMIQCVGSRDDERPYCSRVCCTEAIKNALKIKELSPSSAVYVLYRDIRTYGFAEGYYTRARQQGVVFVRYDAGRKPEVAKTDAGLAVRVHDQTLDVPVEIAADLVVLSAGIVADENNKRIAQFLGIPLDKDGFFREAHGKLRPVDAAVEGVFLAGMAQYPKTIEESIAQAQAAVARAAAVLWKSGRRPEQSAHPPQMTPLAPGKS